MPEPGFWDRWEWARAHHSPKPKLMPADPRAGGQAEMVPLQAMNPPRYDDIYVLDGDRGASEKAAPPKAVDQVDGRNPFYRPPMTILADGSQSGPSVGEVARRAVDVPARLMIDVGKAMEDNAYQGDVAKNAASQQEGRWFVKFPWGTPMPLLKTTEAWGAANGIIGGVGSHLHGAGAGLLAVTGNFRPLAENATSRSINKYTPLHGQSLVDDLVEHNMNKTYGLDGGSRPLW